jgi:hypothetical protein
MLFNIAIGLPRPPSDGTPDPTRNLNKDVLHKSLKGLLQASSLTTRLTRKSIGALFLPIGKSLEVWLSPKISLFKLLLLD